jgi:hypothetical protein
MNAKEQKIMRITLKGPKPETLAELMRKFRLDIWGAGGPRRLPDGTISMEAYVPEEVMDQLKKEGVDFEIIEDATKVGKERRKEVGRGDRFKSGKITPHGLGRKE